MNESSMFFSLKVKSLCCSRHNGGIWENNFQNRKLKYLQDYLKVTYVNWVMGMYVCVEKCELEIVLTVQLVHQLSKSVNICLKNQ